MATDVPGHWANSIRRVAESATARSKVRAIAAAAHPQSGCGEVRGLPIAMAYLLSCGLVPVHFAMAAGTVMHQPSKRGCALVKSEPEHHSQQLGGFRHKCYSGADVRGSLAE